VFLPSCAPWYSFTPEGDNPCIFSPKKRTTFLFFQSGIIPAFCFARQSIHVCYHQDGLPRYSESFIENEKSGRKQLRRMLSGNILHAVIQLPFPPALWGFSSLPAMLPAKSDTPRTGTNSLSLWSSGVVWGGQVRSPPSSNQYFVFYIIAKGILQSHAIILSHPGSHHSVGGRPNVQCPKASSPDCCSEFLWKNEELASYDTLILF